MNARKSSTTSINRLCPFRKAVDRKCLGGHVALGIDVGVERRPGWYPVEQFNAAQFNEPMALGRIEACRFGVEDDFAHMLL